MSVSLTTQCLSTALKDLNRLEPPGAKKKEKDTSAQSAAKAVNVFISTDAKMQFLNILSSNCRWYGLFSRYSKVIDE